MPGAGQTFTMNRLFTLTPLPATTSAIPLRLPTRGGFRPIDGPNPSAPWRNHPQRRRRPPARRKSGSGPRRADQPARYRAARAARGARGGVAEREARIRGRAPMILVMGAAIGLSRSRTSGGSSSLPAGSGAGYGASHPFRYDPAPFHAIQTSKTSRM